VTPAHPERKPFSRQVENLIANLRGFPEDTGRSRLRPTRSIDELVEKMLVKHRIGKSSPEETIRDAWAQIVGESNQQFAHPSRIDRERCLVVAVSDAVVRQELQFNKKLLIKRIRSLAGCDGIREIALRSG
jgi:hypothetical protein